MASISYLGTVLVDLGTVLVDDANGVPPIGVDGAHFGVEGSDWSAETHGPAIVGLGGFG